MTIGERIKKRRKELGISVDEVAAKLNKNRATIYRYESDEIENMSINILEPLAHALNTTPAYLMGWEKETKEFEELSYDLKGRNLLKTFNKLNNLGKDKAIDNIQDLTQIDKYIINNNKINEVKEKDEKQDKIKKFNLKEELEKLDPIETVAAHNDHWDEPGEMEKMKQDLDEMDKWEW